MIILFTAMYTLSMYNKMMCYFSFELVVYLFKQSPLCYPPRAHLLHHCPRGSLFTQSLEHLEGRLAAPARERGRGVKPCSRAGICRVVVLEQPCTHADPSTQAWQHGMRWLHAAARNAPSMRVSTE